MLHAADDEVLAQKLLCCLAQLVSVRKSRNGDPLNIIGSIEKTGYVSSGLPLRRDQPSDTYMNDDDDADADDDVNDDDDDDDDEDDTPNHNRVRTWGKANFRFEANRL